MPQSDLDTAKANFDGALAQLKASEAAVSQAEASVNQAQVDLDHTVISTPIDGVVINRNVDVGQTVAASFQAPTLFVIANDLARMQVNASIDEADIGRVRPEQEVSFRVDAYPDRTFAGRVEQVRLQPTTQQNVVSYIVVVETSNSDMRLRPYLTANLKFQVHSRENALLVPNAALRYKPPVKSVPDILEAADYAKTVRGGFASFFFHPYLAEGPNGAKAVRDLDRLILELQRRGYKFVSAEELARSPKALAKPRPSRPR